MEHRWGQRFELELPVVLRDPGGRVQHALLRNVSASGAFVETFAAPRSLTEVEVEFEVAGSHASALSATAFVVRTEDAGIAVEWEDFNPAPVAVLMAAPLGSGWQSIRSDAA